MSGMAIKFTSLVQIEAHQFVLADEDRPCAQEARMVVANRPLDPTSSDDRFGGHVSGSGGPGRKFGVPNWLWPFRRAERCREPALEPVDRPARCTVAIPGGAAR